MENTPFVSLLGQDAIVNSYHHQCVRQLGDHLRAAAIAQDERIEALYHETLPIMGVQWHPEWLCRAQSHARALFEAFTAACARDSVIS